MNLQFAVKEWGSRGVAISVMGEIDVHSAPQVRQKALEALDNGRSLLVVNLQEVTYMDSTGLGVLIGVLRRARENGGDMVLVSSNPRLNKIFEITGMGKIFRIYVEEEAAVQDLAGRDTAGEETA